MDAYYTSGLSLKELKTLYEPIKRLSDSDIIKLFPMLELDDACPLCGGALSAPRISRGVKGSTANSYYDQQVICTNCGKTKTEIEKEYQESIRITKIRAAYSGDAVEFVWGHYDANRLDDVVFETLVSSYGILNNTYLKPLLVKPLMIDFFDECKRLLRLGYIRPSAVFNNWLNGFEVEDDGVSFYWLDVPFSVNLVDYVPLKANKVFVRDNTEFINIGEGEYELWQQTAKGLLMDYIDDQMWEGDYECEGLKREELQTLLRPLLSKYSPAQIASMVWSAMAVAEKQANEGPSYKKTGNWAAGVIINRAKRALAEGWDIRPNLISCNVEPTPFEDHLFRVHIPLGETWMYRRIPPLVNGRVEIAPALAPQGKVPATAEMIELAMTIAEEHDLDEPNYLSFDETRDFISVYR
ncbi:hypothetical protein [Adlercreutzia caecimuris]|nr:hypothetical protein [Adlercreutzia caecimuris]